MSIRDTGKRNGMPEGTSPIELEFKRSSPSSLLIPARMIAIFRRLLEEYENRPSLLLSQLLRKRRHAIIVLCSRRSPSIRRRYQAPGLRLVKVSLRLDDALWSELGLLAGYAGVSRCLLFVLMLQLAVEELKKSMLNRPGVINLRLNEDMDDGLEYRERLNSANRRCRRELVAIRQGEFSRKTLWALILGFVKKGNYT